MSDKIAPVVDPPPDPVAATGSVDLTVEQTQPSHPYQLRSRPLLPLDLEVVGWSEAPSVDPHSYEDLPGPEPFPFLSRLSLPTAL